MLLFALVSLVLLAADRRGALGALHSGLGAAVYPLRQMVSTPVRLVESLQELVSSYAHALEENRRLRDERTLLEAKLLKFAALEQENIRLRALLGASIEVGEHFLIAEILSVNLVPYEHLVVVNKGARLGVYAGQPVFHSRGVVGQVVRVSPLSSEVMLMTDPNHAIPVQVNRNGLRTIALGSGKTDCLVLPYLSGSADIQVGDLLVTSGMGGVFPPGYPVATVSEIADAGSSFAKVTAKPVAPLDRIREVLLVWTHTETSPSKEDPTAIMDSIGTNRTHAFR